MLKVTVGTWWSIVVDNRELWLTRGWYFNDAYLNTETMNQLGDDLCVWPTGGHFFFTLAVNHRWASSSKRNVRTWSKRARTQLEECVVSNDHWSCDHSSSLLTTNRLIVLTTSMVATHRLITFNSSSNHIASIKVGSSALCSKLQSGLPQVRGGCCWEYSSREAASSSSQCISPQLDQLGSSYYTGIDRR